MFAAFLCSSASLPYDPGSHQELVDSVLVGRSFDDPAWNERAQYVLSLGLLQTLPACVVSGAGST